MKILVTHATRHGATRGIAERIAHRLERDGLDVTLLPVELAGEVEGYDAYVIGAAAYFFHWLKEATDFVRRHRELLATRPVWLFSSGPLGTETTDAEGRDVLDTAEPKEFAELRGEIHPRDVAVFFGAYDPGSQPIGLMERFSRAMPAVKTALPAGDFRDWHAIDAWADAIAAALLATRAVAGPHG
jgi:menaquinone-dependent protoporphyrinogen oxidase